MKLLLFLGLVLTFFWLAPQTADRRPQIWDTYPLPSSVFGLPAAVSVNGQRLTLEIADEPEEIRQGLSDRESMPRGHGMLFVLEPAGVYPFWMNRMHFPLDIIWMHDGVVVEVATLPPPKFGELPVTHTPKNVADRVLELNAGESTVYGLRIGGTVDGLEDF